MSTRQKVQVWIFVQDEAGAFRVLVLKTNAARGSFWQPVTGSVEKDEALAAAAKREASEETGLTFKTEPVPLGKPFTFEYDGKEIVETSFSLEAARVGDLAARGVPVVKLDPHEHCEYRWVAPEVALKTVKFPSNQAILRALLPKFNQYS